MPSPPFGSGAAPSPVTPMWLPSIRFPTAPASWMPCEAFPEITLREMRESTTPSVALAARSPTGLPRPPWPASPSMLMPIRLPTTTWSRPLSSTPQAPFGGHVAEQPLHAVGGAPGEAEPAAAPGQGAARHAHAAPDVAGGHAAEGRPGRSEEHTSELQSRENLVCRLLLEKKNERET